MFRIKFTHLVINVCFISILIGCVPVNKSSDPSMQTQQFIDRGVAFMEHKRWDLAEASFRIAIELQQIPESYDGLGCVLLAKGDTIQAREIFNNILDWFPEYSTVFWHLAFLEESEGNILLASKWHRRAVLANPVGYKEKTNYALFLNDRFLQDKTDNFSRDLAITYLEDATAIIGK